MSQRTSRIDAVLDAAERRVRSCGYNGVSFRDLAADVGIKSASVHYHFPQKADLGVALVERYAARLLGAVQEKAGNRSGAHRLRAFCDAYRSALVDDGAICLCGMLGAEHASLPEPVARSVRSFFEANIDWVASALEGGSAKTRRATAATVVAALQGSMILAAALDEPAILEATIAGVLREHTKRGKRGPAASR